MTFAEIRGLIDAGLASEPRVEGIRREAHGNDAMWTLNDEAVVIGPSGSTGILVEYISRGRLTHRKIFAASPLIVDRLVTTLVEHLTEYVRTTGPRIEHR